MYGKYITVNLKNGASVDVWVWCTPRTSDEELQRRAKDIVNSKSRLPKTILLKPIK